MAAPSGPDQVMNMVKMGGTFLKNMLTGIAKLTEGPREPDGITYDPVGVAGDRAKEKWKPGEKRMEEFADNGEGPWRPLNARFLAKVGAETERNEFSGQRHKGSRLDVAVWPNTYASQTDPSAEPRDDPVAQLLEWPEFYHGTNRNPNTARNQTKAYDVQLMFWDRRPCGLAVDYLGEPFDGLRNSEYHVVHGTNPVQGDCNKNGKEPDAAGGLFRARFARRRYVKRSADPSFRVEWWKRWRQVAEPVSTSDQCKADEILPTLPIATRLKSSSHSSKADGQGRNWAQKQWPDSNNNYAPCWQLCHLIFYQIDHHNVEKPVGTTPQVAAQQMLKLTSDVKHPIRRFFHVEPTPAPILKSGTVHKNTRTYAKNRLRHVPEAYEGTNRVYAQCDLMATWGLHCERKKPHLVWWTRSEDEEEGPGSKSVWNSKCVWCHTANWSGGKYDGTFAVKIKGLLLKQRLQQLTRDKKSAPNSAKKQKSASACSDWKYGLEDMAKSEEGGALEEFVFTLEFYSTDHGKSWLCNLKTNDKDRVGYRCAVFRDPSALRDGIHPAMAKLLIQWPAESRRRENNLIWWNEAFAKQLKDPTAGLVVADTKYLQIAGQSTKNRNKELLDRNAVFFVDSKLFDSIDVEPQNQQRRTNDQGVRDQAGNTSMLDERQERQDRQDRQEAQKQRLAAEADEKARKRREKRDAKKDAKKQRRKEAVTLDDGLPSDDGLASDEETDDDYEETAADRRARVDDQDPNGGGSSGGGGGNPGAPAKRKRSQPRAEAAGPSGSGTTYTGNQGADDSDDGDPAWEFGPPRERNQAVMLGEQIVYNNTVWNASDFFEKVQGLAPDTGAVVSDDGKETPIGAWFEARWYINGTEDGPEEGVGWKEVDAWKTENPNQVDPWMSPYPADFPDPNAMTVD